MIAVDYIPYDFVTSQSRRSILPQPKHIGLNYIPYDFVTSQCRRFHSTTTQIYSHHTKNQPIGVIGPDWSSLNDMELDQLWPW